MKAGPSETSEASSISKLRHTAQRTTIYDVNESNTVPAPKHHAMMTYE